MSDKNNQTENYLLKFLKFNFERLVEINLRIVGDNGNPYRKQKRDRIIEEYKQNAETAFREFRPIFEAYEEAKIAYTNKMLFLETKLKNENSKMNDEYREGRNDYVAEAHYAATQAILAQSLKTPFYATHIAATTVDAANAAQNNAAGCAAAALALRELATVASDPDPCRAAATLFDIAAERQRHREAQSEA